MRRKTLKNFRLFPLTLCFLFLFFCWGCRRQTETGTNGPDPKSQALNQVVNTYFSSAIASQYLNTRGFHWGKGLKSRQTKSKNKPGRFPITSGTLWRAMPLSLLWNSFSLLFLLKSYLSVGKTTTLSLLILPVSTRIMNHLPARWKTKRARKLFI